MRILLVTWDGAGNLPPTLALIAALTAKGHEVFVLGHDSQQQEILQAGGQFRPYVKAPQLNQSQAQPAFDFKSWLAAFNDTATRDFAAEADSIKPDVLIIDSMMGPTLEVGWSTGIKMVALVHGAYSAMAPWSIAIDAADLALNCSYQAFDQDAKFPPKMVFVGPLRPILEEKAADPWVRKLPGRPLVVASLSSGHQGPFQLGLLQRIADALSSLPVEGLITTGRGIAPEEITAAPHITTARNVDHSLTLPQASLFITHCGHGSVMAALRAGVPMLCLPPVADQPLNAELVKRLSLGETIDVMAPATLIANAAASLLANDKIHKAARKFAEKNTFEPRPQQAVELIEKLLR